MKATRFSVCCRTAIGALAGLLSSEGFGQSTVFTYQGRLEDAGAPASGLHDLRFSLFDAPAGGVQVGSTQCVDNVNVANGLFTVQLDFGQQFATPAARFLAIDVRDDSGLNCANTTGFATLSPRQQLTATPLSSHAKSAFALDAADGSPASAVFVDNVGKVGIGTTSPQAPLHVNGTLQWGGTTTNIAWSGQDGLGLFLEQAGSSLATSKIRLQTSKSGDFSNYSQFFIDPDAGFSFMKLGTGNGNVGIGTTSPFFRLTTVASFPSDGIGVIGSSPNAPAFSLGASGHGTSYLGMATDSFNFSQDAAPGDLVLLSPVGKRLLLQNGNARSALAIVAGNVGIGTNSPGAKLDVNGTTRTQVLEITGADLAEKFPASEKLEPGMVVAIDGKNAGKLCLSRGAYNHRVAGVVSGANNFSVGAVLGNLPGCEDAPPIALSGRVFVQCDASAGAIEPGDLLTTSDIPGHAMKATDRERSHGAVIGKAMERLSENGRGLVLVLVNLQ